RRICDVGGRFGHEQKRLLSHLTATPSLRSRRTPSGARVTIAHYRAAARGCFVVRKGMRLALFRPQPFACDETSARTSWRVNSIFAAQVASGLIPPFPRNSPH